MGSYIYRDIPIYEEHGVFFILTRMGNIIKRSNFNSLADAKDWINRALGVECEPDK